MYLTILGERWHFKFDHRRYTEATHSGWTGVTITPSAGFPLIGTALCSSEDNFNYAIGRKVAITRAIKRLPREVRAAIWAAYFHRCRVL